MRNPYKGTNYDDAGMPLGTTTADFDNAEEVRKNMVADKPQEPVNHVFDIDYEQKPLPKKFTLEEPLNKQDYNRAVKDEVNIPGIDSDINRVDIEDTGVKRALYVDEADKKGFTEVQELPKVEERGNVEEIANGENYDKIVDPILPAQHDTDANTEVKHEEPTNDVKELDTVNTDVEGLDKEPEANEQVPDESTETDTDEDHSWLEVQDSYPESFVEDKDENDGKV